ncbi:MAG: hypothetical protein ABW139_14505 [Candidatus Thiodiazotropha sp. DIVDIV]
MEQKKPFDPGKVALLGVQRVIRDSHTNQVLTVNYWEFLCLSVSRILHCLLDYFVASCHGRIIFPEGFGIRNPVIPRNLGGPMQFQAVTKKKQSKRNKFLPELPFNGISVSSQLTQPAINRGKGVFLESHNGMIVDEELNMPPIPGKRLLKYVKKFQYVTVFNPENLNSRVCGRFSFSMR